jgi:methyl-accepting chemotaxis protein
MRIFLGWSISTKAWLLAIAALTSLLLNGATSYFVGRHLIDDVERTRAIGTALGLHNLRDMFHDNMRGIVYRALSAKDAAINEKVLEDEIKEVFSAESDTRKMMTALSLPNRIQTESETIGKEFETYLNSARDLIRLTRVDRSKALSDLANFESEFEHLRLTNEHFAVVIADEARSIENNAKRFSQIAQVLSAAMLAICLASISALAGFLLLSLLRRLRHLEDSMLTLAGGDVNFEIKDADKTDEIGDMARAVLTFQQRAIQRMQLQEEANAQRLKIADAEVHAEQQRSIAASIKQKTTEEQTQLINELGSALDRLARGDMTVQFHIDNNDLFKQIKADINTMTSAFRRIGNAISGAAFEVKNATREIGDGVSDLSRRTDHQASSLEETAAAMEQLAATVLQNSNIAQQADHLAADAKEVAVDGGKIAEQAVSAMSEIEVSSKQINDIVGMIQEIAFQTNILALNAAVEAARAGEAGKGFAVVAGEVRTLSQRANSASKDIKHLITSSDDQVRKGVKLVRQAGESLANILNSAASVSNLVSDIARAARQQTSGIEQVSAAVMSMEQLTRQNAALVEETNAALESTQSQIEQLSEAVAFFRTDSESLQKTRGQRPIDEARRQAFA